MIHHPTVVPLPRRDAPTAWIQGALALSLADPEADEPPIVRLVNGTRTGLEKWAGRFAQAAAEIAGGNRPVSQLLRHTSPEVYQDLARRAQLVATTVGHPAGQGLVQAVRPVVESVHACWLDDERVEVSARVRYGERSRAVAFRLVQQRGRWVATALEFA